MSQFNSRYFDIAERDINEELNLESFIDRTTPFPYAYHCHEGVLAFAYALNQTIAGRSIYYRVLMF